MLSHLLENNLSLEKQPGFVPGVWCINQLLAIAFYLWQEVRGVFLNISKAFGKI